MNLNTRSNSPPFRYATMFVFPNFRMSVSMEDRLLGEAAQCYISDDDESEKPELTQTRPLDQSKPPPRAQTGYAQINRQVSGLVTTYFKGQRRYRRL